MIYPSLDLGLSELKLQLSLNSFTWLESITLKEKYAFAFSSKFKWPNSLPSSM